MLIWEKEISSQLQLLSFASALTFISVISIILGLQNAKLKELTYLLLALLLWACSYAPNLYRGIGIICVLNKIPVKLNCFCCLADCGEGCRGEGGVALLGKGGAGEEGVEEVVDEGLLLESGWYGTGMWSWEETEQIKISIGFIQT